MGKIIISLFIVFLLQAVSNVALADGSQASIENNWLMMVTTRNTDPARESEFNDWYDRIDIPDVLEVPGYMRARRGLGQKVRTFPTTDPQGDEGKYVALYDIKSENMDKTIIDMLMASWNMEKTGHSTNLLRVMERVYYHQYTPAYEAPNPNPSGKNKYLYVVKINCCHDKLAEKQFDSWYDTTYIPGIMEAKGLIRTTRYALYRVLMLKPVEIPPFLSVFEIEAESAEQAMNDLHKQVNKLLESGHMSKQYVEGGSTIYLKIGDVVRR